MADEPDGPVVGCPVCGRSIAVAYFRERCAAGQHRVIPRQDSFGRVTPTGRVTTDVPEDQVPITGL